MRRGFGDTAASTPALIARLAQGCRQTYIAQVAAFQVDYNASGLGPAITVDGLYGGNTQAALQLVLDASGSPAQQAPRNCFGDPIPAAPGPNADALAVIPAAAVTPTPAVQTITTTSTASVDMTPWIIGGAVAVAAGLVGYTWWKKRKRR
jgi:hypothetical protein